MTRTQIAPHRGFALLEALIALLVAAFALVAIVRLQGAITKGAGDSIARSEALSVAQARLEALRAQTVTRAGYDALVAGTAAQQCNNGVAGSNANFNECWQTAAVADAPLSRAATVTVTWTDANNQQQQVQVQSVIAWDDPLSQGISTLPPSPRPPGSNGPLGDAKRGSGETSQGPGTVTDNNDGTKTKLRDDGVLELLDANDRVLLYLEPGLEFTVIRGRVYFDQRPNSGMPNPSDVLVRLSSEGYCAQDPSALINVPSQNPTYRYFNYACYVGPGWYGNIGVSVRTNNQATVCVGDPAFNGGVSDGTLISPHSTGSATRTYRGFRDSGGTFVSTGVAGGTEYPTAGAPVPSQYPGYGSGQGVNDHFTHHFLLTRVSGGATCATQMAGGEFARNAGKYFCISPDNVDTAVDRCPSIWPNFEGEVAGGGSLNFTLDVVVEGNGVVSSSVGGISCGNACSASFPQNSEVVLTASPRGNQVFTGWSGGGCSGTGPCTVTMNAQKTVTAIFSGANAINSLTVTKTGAGSGTVTSVDGSISCGATCTATYAGATTVTLQASAPTGSTFLGWSGGGCTGTGTCTVAVSGAINVTATFGLSAQTCTTTINGSLRESGHSIFVQSPAGAGTCTKQETVNYTCSLTAPSGTRVVLQSENRRLNVTANCAAQENVNF